MGWNMGGEGRGEGICPGAPPVPTAIWLEGRMLTEGELGTGGGGMGFVEARREAMREWLEEPGRVLISGIVR